MIRFFLISIFLVPSAWGEPLTPTFKDLAAKNLLLELSPEVSTKFAVTPKKPRIFCDLLFGKIESPEHYRVLKVLDQMNQRFSMAALAQSESMPERTVFHLSTGGALHEASGYIARSDYLNRSLHEAAEVPVPLRLEDGLWNSFLRALRKHRRLWKWKVVMVTRDGSLVVEYTTPNESPRRSAVAILERPDRTRLVLHRTNSDREFPDFWSLPGGKIDKRETAFDAIQRETFEETGIHIDRASFLGSEESPLASRNGNRYQIEIFYASVPQNAAVRLSTEHDRYLWISRQAITGLRPIGPLTKRVLLGAQKP